MKKITVIAFWSLVFHYANGQTPAPWTQVGNNIYNPNSGNVGIKVNNPMYPFQIGDGGNDFSGIGFIPNSYTNQYAVIKSLKIGGYGLILRAESQNAGLGQAGVVIRSSDGLSIPSKVTVIGGQLDFRTNNDFNTHIDDGTPGTSALFISHDQKIGIGVINPGEKLDVSGTIRSIGTNAIAFSTQSNLGVSVQQANINNDFVNSNSYLSIFAHNMHHNGTGWVRRNQYSSGWATVFNNGYYDIAFAPDNQAGAANETVNPSSFFRIGVNGNVGIGTTTTGIYKLAVNGKVIAKEIKVKDGTPWPDYVFHKDYTLMSLASLEAFIQKNDHLPNIPSAQEVKENDGIELGAMNAKLLEKIEELTLYVIELKKENETIKEEVKKLSARQDAKDRK